MAETFEILGWPGGLNLSDSPAIVEPTELVVADNIDLGDKGELKLRRGATVLNPETDLGDLHFDWIWAWWSPNQDEPTLVLFDDTTDRIWWGELGGVELDPTFANDGAMVSPAFSYGWFPQAVVMNGLAYITRCAWASSDNHGSYELNLASNASTAITPWDASDVETDEFPRAGALCVAYDRIFAANLQTSASTRLATRLFFSEQLLPMSWSNVNFIDVGPDDGQVITSLKHFGDQILIFKESSIWAIAGSDFSGLGVELYRVDNEIGCAAPGTIADVGTALMFLDPSKGVYAWDGSEFHDVGEKVYPLIRALIDEGDALIEESWGWYHDGCYYLHLKCSDPSLTGTFVYNIQLQAWTIHRIRPSATTSYVDGGRTVVLGVGAEIGIWTLYDGFLDPDGTPVEGLAYTGWLSPAGSSMQHRLHGVEATVLIEDEDQSFSVALVKDYEGSHYAFSDFLTGAGDEGTHVVRTHVADGVRARAFQARIALWTDESPWQ